MNFPHDAKKRKISLTANRVSTWPMGHVPPDPAGGMYQQLFAEDSGAGFARLIDEWQAKPALQLTGTAD